MVRMPLVSPMFDLHLGVYRAFERVDFLDQSSILARYEYGLKRLSRKLVVMPQPA
jgi:hypothetical protein